MDFQDQLSECINKKADSANAKPSMFDKWTEPDKVAQNCGTCYRLTCPTDVHCDPCGILKRFPNWVSLVDYKRNSQDEESPNSTDNKQRLQK